MFKKIILALLAFSLSAGALASCGDGAPAPSSAPSAGSGSEASSAAEPSEEPEPSETAEVSDYTATFAYLVGAEGSNQDDIQALADELVCRELGFHVELMPTSIGTFASIFSTMMAANEPIDVTPIGGNNFSEGMSMGWIANLNDYSEYLTGAFEQVGDYAKVGEINGYLCGLPVNKELNSPYGLVCRKDLMDALGYTPDDFVLDENDPGSYYKLDELFDAVKAAYPDMTPLGSNGYLSSVPAAWVDAPGNSFGVLEDFGQSDTFVNWFETEQYRAFALVEKNWYDKGYMSADVTTMTDTGEVLMKAGQVFSFITAYKPNTLAEKQSQTGYEVVLIPFATTGMKPSLSAGGLFYGCSTAAGDPVRAAQLLNFVYTNGEINDLINWGVEGVDWVETEDGLADFPEGVDASTAATHNDFGWAQPNQFAAHPWAGNPPDIWDQYRAYNDSLLPSRALGFAYDAEGCLNEIAACTAVYEEYAKQIGLGAVEDVDAALAAFNDKLYAAGLETILADKQAQFDAWKASEA